MTNGLLKTSSVLNESCTKFSKGISGVPRIVSSPCYAGTAGVKGSLRGTLISVTFIAACSHLKSFSYEKV